ncbi:uncharacterized protein AMSG_05224 [Thecamonas trahens ATCC 50062]|uniref:Uncharacterized protein n=1 Tax=Thecamonas trahens ATCC 50062 TaxID=461836 RepID=A0A0L0DA51_THETB|nr:hypothetical protein AMSG_05224 [Thecamonas trahens ATCC 50062]KNC49234.1 hypothetical protein AMSG_05224 [Thecamonas trahens ATCC 50062]|eukprot:XP_013757951.1 hypothetical protein AMSG_05224 [Thecamonas trahens ATCC 50062]
MSHTAGVPSGRVAAMAVMAVVMVMGLMVQEAVGQSPVGSKCAGPRSCSECVKRSGCGWCATPLDGAVNGSLAVIGCVEGTFSSGSGCKSHDYMAKQCTVANLYIVLGLVASVFSCSAVAICAFGGSAANGRSASRRGCWRTTTRGSTRSGRMAQRPRRTPGGRRCAPSTASTCATKMRFHCGRIVARHRRGC